MSCYFAHYGIFEGTSKVAVGSKWIVGSGPKKRLDGITWLEGLEGLEGPTGTNKAWDSWDNWDNQSREGKER